MKKCSIVKINEKSENAIPDIKSAKNKIIININQNEDEAFRQFLTQEKWQHWVNLN